MTRLLPLIILLIFSKAFGQTEKKRNYTIEFYLLKSLKPNLDTTKKLSAQFSVDIPDLEDTAFIKDHEILGCMFKKDTVKFEDSIFIDNRQRFEVPAAVTKRINNLKIPLCCGRQFALVVNGEIVYSGYLWNFVSSWGCDGITAFAHDNRIDILRKLPDYDFANDSEDPRRNSILFECLTKTNRLHE